MLRLLSCLVLVTALAHAAQPVITAVTPDSGSSASDRNTSATTLTISGTADAGAAVELLGGAADPPTAVVASGTASGGTWTLTWTSGVTTPGFRYLRVRATPGGTAAAVLSVFIDPASDAPVITAPSTGSFLDDATPTVSGTANPGAAIELYADGDLIATATADPSGAWSATPSGRLPTGLSNLSATQTDLAGNAESAQSAAVAITIDTLTTDVVLYSTTTGLTSDATPNYSGKAEPGATVTLRQGSVGGTILATVTAASDGTWSLAPSASLADGAYNLFVVARDAAGNQKATPAQAVTIDTAVVGVLAITDFGTIGGPVPSGGSTEDHDPVINGTLTGAESGVSIEVTVNGIVIGTTSGSPWSLALNALNDGTYTVTARAIDPAGNSVSAGPATLIISDPNGNSSDRFRPQWDAEIGGTFLIVTNDSTPTLGGLARPNASVTITPTVTVNGSSPGVSVLTPDAQGVFSYTPAPLIDGTYEFQASNTDGSSLIYTLVIDTVAPTGPTALSLASDTGSSGSDRITNDATLIFTATGIADASPSSGSLQATLRLDGVVVATAAVASGSAAFDLTGRELPDGIYGATVTVADAAGNTSPVFGPQSVTVDRFTDPPLLGGVNPDSGLRSNDRNTRSSAGTAIRGRAEPGASVALTLTGPSTITVSATANGSGVFSVVVGALADGTWTVSAIATDVAGNTNLSDTSPDTADPRPSTPITLVIDNTPPAAPTAQISEDRGSSNSDNLTSDNSLTVSGSTVPNGQVVVTLVQGGTTLTRTVIADGSGAYTADFTGNALADGTWQLTATPTDVAGNLGPATTFPITIDTIAPTVALTTVADDNTGTLGSLTVGTTSDRVTNDSDVLVSGTVESGATVELLIDGTPSTATVVATTWSRQAGVLTAGTRQFAARATDAAGNIATTANVPVTIDLSMADPSISAVTPNRGFVGGTGGGTYTTNSDTPSVTVSAESGAAVRLEVSPFGANTWTQLAPKAASGGSASWTGAELALSAPPNQVTKFDLRVAGVDIAGNASAGFGTAVLIIDRVVPATAPSITTVADDTFPFNAAPWNTPTYTTDRYTRDNTLTVSGTGALADTADSQAYVRIYINGVGRGWIATPTGGAWSVTLGAVVADGPVVITAANGDLAGNESAQSTAYPTVTVDTRRPLAVITGMTNADTGRSATDRITQTARPEFAGTVTDPGGSDDANLPLVRTVLKRGATTVDTQIDDSSEAGVNDTWAYTVPGAQPDGLYTLEVNAFDLAGGTSVTVTTTFTIDRVANAVGGLALTSATDTGESSSDRITRLARPSVTGAVVETQAIVRIYRGTTAGALIGTATAAADGSWTVALSGDLAEGANTLAVTQEDLAGNVSTAANLVVTLDTLPPAAAVITDLTSGTDSGASGDRRTNAANPTVAGTCTADTDRLIVTAVGPGGTVRTVTVDVTLGATTWEAAFAGLPEGVWSISAVAVDTAGNQAVPSAAYSLTVDRTAPAVAIIGLTPATDSGVSSDNRTNVVRPVLTGSAASEALSVTLTIGGGVGTVIVPVVNGAWSWTPSSDLADGSYTVTATAVDAAGNVSAATPATTLVIDTVAPAVPAVTAIVGDTGTAGDFLTTDDTLIISGTAEAGASVAVYVDGALVGRATANGGGAWSFDLTGRPLADGTYDLTCIATDAAGNAGATSPVQTATIDTTTAVPALIRLDTDSANPNDRITSDTTPTLSGSAEPFATVVVTANGPGGPHIVNVTAGADGSWTTAALPVLADGAWTVTAVATDPAGNSAGPSVAWPFTIDATAPAAPAITAFAGDSGVAGDNITSDTTLILSGTAEANATVVLTRDGVEVARVIADVSGTWSADLTATGLVPGDYAFVASAIDAAGNPGSAVSATRTITIDTTPDPIPLITGISTDSGRSGSDAITNDTSLTVTGKGVAGSTIELLDGGVLVGTVVVQGDGTWSIAIAGPLTQGSHALTAVSDDNAGNISDPSPAFNVVIDTTAPSATVTSIAGDSGVANDGITNDNTWVVGGSSEANAIVIVFIDGLEVGRTTALANGSWSFDASAIALSDGLHAVTAAAIDVAGNTGAISAARSATIDTNIDPVLIAGFSDDSGVLGDNTTNDRSPTLFGNAEPGATVTVRLGSTVVGTVVASSTGSWTLAVAGPLADGVQVFTADQVDVAGNGPSPLSTLSLTVDATITAPTILAIETDSGRSASDGITNDSSLTIRGSADPGSTVVVRVVGAVVGTVTAGSDGRWSLATTLGEGARSVTATASDAAGNSAASAPRSVTVDQTAPPAPLITGWGSDSGTQGDGITSDNTLSLTGTAEPGAVVTIFADGVAVGSVTAAADGSWSLTLAALPDGTRSLTATASDAAGNTSASSPATTVIIDRATSAPVISGISPDSGRSASDRITNAATVTINGTAEAGATVTVRNGATVLGTALADSSGAWSLAITPAAGVLSLGATAVDAAGNSDGPGATVAVTVDRTAPAAPTLVLPASPTTDTTPTLSGTAEANATVEVLVGGVVVASVLADGSGAWTWTPTVAWPDAAYVLSARATDAAGNVGPASATQSLTVDTVAPAAAAISGISPDTGTPGDGITSNTRPTLAGTADPNALVEIRLGGSTIATVVAGADGSWTLDLPVDGDELTDGSYALTAVAIDSAGNASTPSPVFTLVVHTSAAAAPAVTAVSPSSGALPNLNTGSSTPTLSGTTEAGATVTVLIDGVVVGTVVADGSGNWSFPLTSALAEGAHAITTFATDAAGNSGPTSTAVTLTVDLSTTIPAVTSLTPDTGTVGDAVTSDLRPSFSGAAEPGATVTLTIRDSGGTVVATRVATADGSGVWSVGLLSDLVDGAYTATPEATDALGNSASGSAFAFTIDAVVPAGAITAVTASDGAIAEAATTEDPRPVVSGTATDASAVRLYLDGALVATVPVSGGAWSADLGALGITLSNGTHSFAVVAVALSGALSPLSAERTLVVNVPPAKATDRRVEVKPEACGFGSNLPLAGFILLLCAAPLRRRRAGGLLVLAALFALPAMGQAGESTPPAEREDWHHGGWELLIGSTPRPDQDARYIRTPFAAPADSDWRSGPRLGLRRWSWLPDADLRHGPWAAFELGWFRLSGDETAGAASDPSLAFTLHSIPAEVHLGWRWQVRPWLALQAGGLISGGPMLGTVSASDSADGTLRGGDGLGAGLLWGYGATLGVRARWNDWEAGLDGRWSRQRANLAFERREIVSGTTVARDRIELREDIDGLSWALALGYRF